MNVNGKEENKSKKDFLQYLLELTKSGSESPSMTMKEIKAILIACFRGSLSLTCLKFVTCMIVILSLIPSKVLTYSSNF